MTEYLFDNIKFDTDAETSKRFETILVELRQMSNVDFAEGLKRFGIKGNNALGIRVPELRKLARKHKNDHQLALDLWDTNIHEARILATLIDDPNLVSIEQADAWVFQLSSWDLCDQLCVSLLSRTDFREQLIERYISSEQEFVKRTALVLIATIVHNRNSLSNEKCLYFLKLIFKHCTDDKTYIKKAAVWALKNLAIHNGEIAAAVVKKCRNEKVSEIPSLRWIANRTLNNLKK